MPPPGSISLFFFGGQERKEKKKKKETISGVQYSSLEAREKKRAHREKGARAHWSPFHIKRNQRLGLPLIARQMRREGEKWGEDWRLELPINQFIQCAEGKEKENLGSLQFVLKGKSLRGKERADMIAVPFFIFVKKRRGRDTCARTFKHSREGKENVRKGKGWLQRFYYFKKEERSDPRCLKHLSPLISGEKN